LKKKKNNFFSSARKNKKERIFINMSKCISKDCKNIATEGNYCFPCYIKDLEKLKNMNLVLELLSKEKGE